ncbi:MAG: aromatic ring-hydroxylating dioxygenase subunit alpha [Myxococcota bacterium]
MDLVPNQWYAVLDPREVPSDRPIQRRRLGEDLVFWRDTQGRIRAALDRCPHRGAAMSLGVVKDGCLECPFHGFVFDADGRCTHMPAHPGRSISPAMALRTWPVREAHDLVWLWNGDAPPAEDIPFFEFDGFSWAGSQRMVTWNVHYTRSIENQLDWAHLPFVHRTTIGRFVAPEVEVTSRWEGPHLFSGTAQSVDAIHFITPNVWTLQLSDRLKLFLAFVPIDDGSMLYISRAYQAMYGWPIDQLFGAVQALFNPIVLAQDHRVVDSQPKGPAELRTLGLPVPSDDSILAYLRWRESSKKGAIAAK